MLDRYERMDFFIKSLAATYKNADLESMPVKQLSDDIYYNLTRMGVKKADKQVDFEERTYFNDWIAAFFRNPTSVYVASSWKYFCQFINDEEAQDFGKEKIKIYIPQDADHIEKSAEIIFAYLEKLGVAHKSKIGKKARFDDIVIRLENEQDALDLIDFVTKNEYILEGMIAHNPFAFSYKGIALACDKQLSYNACISDLITAYIRHGSEKHTLDKASYDDFVRFTKHYYYEHFIQKKNLGEVIGDSTLIKENDNSFDTNKLIVNTKNIIDLFLKGLDPNFTIDDFFQEYRIRCDNKQIELDTYEFQNARMKDNENEYSVSEIDNFLFEAVRIISNKAKETEEGGLKSNNYYEREALNTINGFLRTNQLTLLTRSEDLREDAKNFNFREKMIHTLEQKQLNLNAYYNYMKEIKNKADFNFAILQTYEKYQDRYEQGFSNLDGTEWCVNAIKSFIYYNNAKGFTRENNARYNLERYSSKDTAKGMIEKYIGHEINSDKDIASYVQGLANKQVTKDYYK